jgi:nicotinamide mononucleotide transporter
LTWIWTALEVVAVLFTLANVWLAVKENMWTWPTGIVAVLLTFVLYWHKLIYLNAWLQIVYFLLSIHGWYEWLHGGVNKTERRISWVSRMTWATTMPIGVALTFLFLYVEHRLAPEGTLPIWDALTTAFSIVGQYMLNMKLIENWIIWAVVDVIYVFMLVDQHLYYLAALNGFFIILCAKGFIDWRRSAETASASV